MSKISEDKRIDKRLKGLLMAEVDAVDIMQTELNTREQIMEAQQGEQGKIAQSLLEMVMSSTHFKDTVPEEGLITTTEEFISHPDGNTVKIQYIRPDTDETVPCVYYIHGGGMMVMSCFNEMYACWGRCIARQGIGVAMVDFRNAMWPSTAPEVAPFPAGLNDCVSGLKWVKENSEKLNIDKENIIVAGESGGGNLTLATGLKLKQEGNLELIKGLYALCPYIAGYWPLPENPSSEENEGILLSLHSKSKDSFGALVYGIDEYKNKNPLAWPSFATEDDVKGFPKTYILVNECDPLRDEGINFYRMLVEADVDAQCRQVMGTLHGSDVFCGLMSVSDETAMSIANFVKN